ncbi:kinase-like protein [Lentinus tigrinus ALCF2SS1-7]|uniref:Kinase-like protein n=1 Tax=Lentinus tigrinus ALCF2SS1-6 TaxID=1328759 RepID=A0A5C2SS80_9APHY|nr:kinase-like protein [Lentinus tigrinus ALCF2SS1-6]RPD80159.1 kinase-like protein [Lentinus tigrinus ALCF2SS1-7]
MPVRSMAAFSPSSPRIHRHPSRRQSASEASDGESDETSSCASQSSIDEEAVNCRISPYWCAYRSIIEARGFRLDTCRDVKQWYHDYWAVEASQGRTVIRDLPGYLRACRGQDENDLCQDAGLPDRLFRGTQCSTGVKVVIKAVHLSSREYDVIRYLSSPALRTHPMNHCIPVLDLIEVPQEKLAFIVMEEWSAQLATNTPCSLVCFLNALRQCIEHIAFMHAHHIAHLDVSIRNVLTDYFGHYAFVDYELSSRYDAIPNPRIRCPRRTEVPPELERGEASDPYKVDVYGLGVLMLCALKLSDHDIPELYPLIRQMLHDQFEQRPAALQALAMFNTITADILLSKRSTVQQHPQTPTQQHRTVLPQ